jgi:hypothetical protein
MDHAPFPPKEGEKSASDGIAVQNDVILEDHRFARFHQGRQPTAWFRAEGSPTRRSMARKQMFRDGSGDNLQEPLTP